MNRREASMRPDDKSDKQRPREQLQERPAEAPEASHVVFDFTGLDRPNVGDLALIITARLRSEPGDEVWAKSLPEHTARILEALKLNHLFRRYPEAGDELN